MPLWRPSLADWEEGLEIEKFMSNFRCEEYTTSIGRLADQGQDNKKMVNHPRRNRAIATIHGQDIDFGTTASYVCVYGAYGNLRHNSDYVIVGNHDEVGTLIYSVIVRGRERLSSPRKAECVEWCEDHGADAGYFFDTSVAGGAWRGWDGGRE